MENQNRRDINKCESRLIDRHSIFIDIVIIAYQN